VDQKQTFRNSLKQAIHSHITPPLGLNDRVPLKKGAIKFDSQKFFDAWYFRHHQAHFFLFRKNLKVTNIQFAELLALIRVHSHRGEGNERYPAEQDSSGGLQFVAQADFTIFMGQLFQTFVCDAETQLGRSRKLGECLDELIDQYWQILANQFVFDSYFGSAVIFTPFGVTLDLHCICAYAGYVHSCGHLVFLENANELRRAELFEKVGNYLRSLRGQKKRIRLIAFAHEEFTAQDRAWQDELEFGLDDVKLFEHKFYVGRTPLVTVLQELSGKFRAQLKVERPGHSRSTHEVDFDFREIDETKSLWLITDRSITRDLSFPGRTKFLICYEQLFTNASPLFFFEENKPAWAAPITIPHSLMAAMVNITKPSWPRDVKIVCADPFSGSGTSWFEAEKHWNVYCINSDRDPVCSLLFKDNERFLKAGTSAIETWIRSLNRIDRSLKKLGAKGPIRPKKLISCFPSEVRQFIAILLRETSNHKWHQRLDSIEKVNEFERQTELPERLVLYLALRATIRHARAIERGREKWHAAFRDESERLRFQLGQLVNLRRRGAKATERDRVSIFAHKYSNACCVWPEKYERFTSDPKVEVPRLVQDARKLFAGRYDFIVTDPPYGYNQEVDFQQLARLYLDLFVCLVRALKNDGQIVLAVPDTAQTGSPFPAFTTRFSVTMQILKAARQAGRVVVPDALVVPHPAKLFSPPYYWESGRALRRSILHFQLRKAAT
jgi:hypothetical protein